MKTPKLPQYKPVKYVLNSEKVVYTCDQKDILKSPLNMLTSELILVPASDRNAPPQPVYLLRSTNYRNGAASFITNLYNAGFPGWNVGYSTQVIENKKVYNTVVVKTAIKPKALQVYYFYAPEKMTIPQRIAFAKTAIPLLEKFH